MVIELKLSPLKVPQLGPQMLAGPSLILSYISQRNKLRADGDSGSPVYMRRKEELINRLRALGSHGDFDSATRIPDRQRLLISLYAEFGGDGSSGWLPAFDEQNAESILGRNALTWHAGRRRQAALLFFTHYTRLGSGLSVLCARLLESFAGAPARNPPVITWQQYSELIFTPDGASRVVRAAEKGARIEALIQRYCIPEGAFAEDVRKIFLLRVLSDCELGKSQEVLEQVLSVREAHESPSTLMGAAALRIMVQRVKNEANGSWPNEWQPWIQKLGGDPRLGRSTAEGTRWWHWATDDELRLAQRGVTGLTLAFFLKFLDGTVDAEQWRNRSEFLLRLFNSRKIEEARLVVNADIFNRLPAEHRGLNNVSRLIQTTADTSMICLRCVDDLFLIEGTHNFGLRVFRGSFPVQGFWNAPRRSYRDGQIRIPKAGCAIFIQHDQGGNWRRNFYDELRQRWHLEWT